MNILCPVCSFDCKDYVKKWIDYSVYECPRCQLSFCKDMKLKEKLGNSSPVHIEGTKMMEESYYNTKLIAEKRVKKRIKVYEKYLNKECKSVLEIGCGPGVLYEPFRNNLIDWQGSEINPHWIEFGEKNNIPIKNYRLDKLDKEFDLVIAHQVLEHVENPLNFINSITRVLSKNGILHFELPNNNSLTSIIRKISPKISYDCGFIQPPMHLRAYTKKTLNYLLSNNGYQVKSIFTCGNNNSIWGQIRNYTNIQKVLYSFSSMVKMGSLLVGIAKNNN